MEIIILKSHFPCGTSSACKIMTFQANFRGLFSELLCHIQPPIFVELQIASQSSLGYPSRSKFQSELSQRYVLDVERLKIAGKRSQMDTEG